ncbi:unnamed protein product [Choristocarpus tenellus]
MEATDGPIPCLSTLVKWRPFYITKATQKTCVCVHHMTTDLLVQCLRENWNKVHCRTVVGDDGQRTCACTCEFCDKGVRGPPSRPSVRNPRVVQKLVIKRLVWMEHARLATGLITPCGSALE